MIHRSMMYSVLVTLCGFVLAPAALARDPQAKLYSVRAKAETVEKRNLVGHAGIAIDGVFSDSITFLGTKADIKKLKNLGFELEVTELPAERWAPAGFPLSDALFHDYKETVEAIDELVAKAPQIVTKISIGKSLEGREMWGVRISGSETPDSLPTAIFVGCHHAREHLSVEVPLKLAQYLVSNYSNDRRIRELVDTREIYIVPMVNPDGAEHDISSGSYKYWRKNRRPNGDGSYGVDLNRNYGKGFGGPGSSTSTSSDIYHGPSAFSEPETQNVRDFVRARKRATVLLSFHTFSELVLWPWGGTNDVIEDVKDRTVFETLGKKFASWNGYTPQKSSDLYLASGDTTDWAYDELKIFAFTFELSPSSMFLGGFYPGAKAIEPTFKANLEPALHMIEMADDPYAVLME